MDREAWLATVHGVASVRHNLVAKPPPPPNCSPQWLYQFTFPPRVQEHSLFFIVFRFFDDGHSDRCEVMPHCSFALHFSNNYWCWASFHVPLGHLSSLERCPFRSSAHFWLGCLFFWYWAPWAVCIFWRLILCLLLCLQIFCPILRVVFLYSLWFLLLWKSIKLNKVPFFYFSFLFSLH